uniref:HXXXD-type acyl-transferase family protein n=1 Tax=Oryza rufipogon TaxID=4529 RepID=A0A0E0MU90_ORYRU
MASCINGGELHVRVVHRRLVQASDESLHPHVLAVSNLDLLPQTIQVSMFCIYPKLNTSGGGFHDVVAAFAAGLPSLLNHFFPLAGRIRVSPCSGLPEIHCYNQGAELVVGEADVALASLDYGTVGASVGKILLPYAGDVALSVQVVSFACGGFTVAWGTNHVVVDGSALSRLVSAWSELARSGTLSPGSWPNHDRSVFRPRAPPSYGASLDEAFTPLDGERQVNVLTRDESFVDVRLYYIEAADIARLREQARATRVQAVSAYLWKALATVVGARDARCRMVWWVDGRRRLTSSSQELRAAMRNYVGNVTTFALAEATVEEIQRKPLAEVASMARDAITAPAYDEHFQELVDWMEVHKAGKQRYIDTASIGLGSPAVSVTAFASFEVDTDFGYGHAAMALPTSSSSARLCTGFVQIAARPGGGDGSWFASAILWPRLAAALESDERLGRIFKPVTADYVGNVVTFTLAEATVEEPLPGGGVHGARRDHRAGKLVAETWTRWRNTRASSSARHVEAATVRLGSPTVTVSAFSSFRLDTDFGFGREAVPLCSGFVQIAARPCGDGSWLASAFVWRRRSNPTSSACSGLSRRSTLNCSITPSYR